LLFVILALPIAGIGIVLRIDQPFKEEPTGENVVNTDPTTWDRFQKVSEARARQIAFKEVTQREGWSGTITQAELGEFGWEVTVRREADASHDYRVVEVDAKTGAIGDYRTVNPKTP
jgi:Peptidase propeptide and YPEB domain